MDWTMRVVGGACLAAFLSISAHAQWLTHRDPQLPRTSTGAVDLTASTPRMADGRPDFSGIWMADASADAIGSRGRPTTNPYSKFFLNVAADLPSREAPMRPWAAELYRSRREEFGKDNPTNRCLPHGIPRMWTQPDPIRIVQTRGLTTILQEFNTSFRLVFTDARQHPDTMAPTWHGYSVGRWDADTLAIDTRGFNDKTWLDVFGHPHSEALQDTERVRRRDLGHLEVAITINDPDAYTAPFSFTQGLTLMPDTELLESICNENNIDLAHIVGK